MQTKRLGNSDLDITSIGFGAWAIGGPGWAYSWGEQDDLDSEKAIHKALELGINWIDTAAIYGNGHSETVVGKALKNWRGAKPYLFTKCALTWDKKGEVGHSLKAASVRKELDDSLRRLGADVIDLYQIHWPDPVADIEEGWTELAKLQQEGKVRWIGLSNFNVDQIKRAESIAPVTSLQPPYSMLRRAIEDEILPYCEKQNIGVIVYSPMMSGLLTGSMTKERAENLPAEDWRSKNPEFKEPKLSRNVRLVDLLRRIGNNYGRSPGEVAIAWTLRNPAVTGAIAGGRSADQVQGIAGAGNFRLSQEETNEIEDFIDREIKKA